jgi:hypothetical protein
MFHVACLRLVLLFREYGCFMWPLHLLTAPFVGRALRWEYSVLFASIDFGTHSTGFGAPGRSQLFGP